MVRVHDVPVLYAYAAVGVAGHEDAVDPHDDQGKGVAHRGKEFLDGNGIAALLDFVPVHAQLHNIQTTISRRPRVAPTLDPAFPLSLRGIRRILISPDPEKEDPNP